MEGTDKAAASAAVGAGEKSWGDWVSELAIADEVQSGLVLTRKEFLQGLGMLWVFAVVWPVAGRWLMRHGWEQHLEVGAAIPVADEPDLERERLASFEFVTATTAQFSVQEAIVWRE